MARLRRRRRRTGRRRGAEPFERKRRQRCGERRPERCGERQLRGRRMHEERTLRECWRLRMGLRRIEWEGPRKVPGRPSTGLRELRGESDERMQPPLAGATRRDEL